MDNKDLVAIFGEKKGEGPGGDVTAAAVASAIHSMTAAQKSGVRSDLGAEPQRLTVTVTVSAGTYTGNKTFAEMWTAYHTNHKIVTVEMGDTEFVLSAADPSGMAFTSLSVVSGVTTIKTLAVDDNNTWSYTEFATEQKPTTVTDLSSTSITLAAAANTEYIYNELTALTISSFPASGEFSIVFVSGTTPTSCTWPATLKWPSGEAFDAPASCTCEINVKDGLAIGVAFEEVSA